MRIITESTVSSASLLRFDAQLVDRFIRLPTASCTNHLLQAVIYWGLIVSSFVVLYVEWLFVHLVLLQTLITIIMRSISIILWPLYSRLKSLSKPRLIRWKLFRRRLSHHLSGSIRMNRSPADLRVIETKLGGKVYYDTSNDLPCIERPHPEDPSGEPRCPCCPDPVSGHRMLIIGDYAYVFGGLCENRNNLESRVSMDLWRMCLIDATWKKFTLKQDVFHMTPISYAWIVTSKWGILSFGGTCFPFGSFNGHRLCRITVFDEDDNYTSVPLISSGTGPLESYGGVLIADEAKDCVYYMGGTDGQSYFNELYRGDIVSDKTRELTYVTWTKLNPNPMMPIDGRYRHEGVLHENHLIFFGGGDANVLFSLNNLLTYNIEKDHYSEVSAIEDPTHGFPPVRDSFAIVHYEDIVYLVGGRHFAEEDNTRRNLDDVWQIDLTTMQWTKRKMKLSFTTSFHAAAIDLEGRVFVFGGHRGTSTNHNNIHRTNMVQSFSIQPSKLQTICKRYIARTYKNGVKLDYKSLWPVSRFISTVVYAGTRKAADAS